MTETARVEVKPERRDMLFALDSIDLSGTVADRDRIARFIPHRGEMALLDRVIWVASDDKTILGLHHADPNGFWVPGHFPGRAMLPGVLMVEAAAQLSCYLWNSQQPEPRLCAFMRIDDTVFRRSVEPGDDLYILAAEVKCSKRRFVTDVQGVLRPGGADQEVAFESRISGLVL